MSTPQSSELVIAEDGTLYHIDLKKADNIPTNLLIAGSAGRVEKIAEQFDRITFQNRNKKRPEFLFIAGEYKGMPMGAFSTGIGVDNIEIVVTELHALFEYNHENDQWIEEPPEINIIRVGSSGASPKSIPVGSIAVSEYSIGLDNLSVYYPLDGRDRRTEEIEKKFLSSTKLGKINPASYVSKANEDVVGALKESAVEAGETMGDSLFSGITTSSPGFYAPEGRGIGRIGAVMDFDEFVEDIVSFNFEGMEIVNHEMETSILFRLAGEALNYRVGAVCLVVDNFMTDEFLSSDIRKKRIKTTINIALEAMARLEGVE